MRTTMKPTVTTIIKVAAKKTFRKMAVKKYFLFILVSSLLSCSNDNPDKIQSPQIGGAQSNTSMTENSVGNGGEFLAQEFVSYGFAIRDILIAQAEGALTINGIDIQAYENAVKQTRVDSVSEPIYDNQGFEVDARYILKNGFNTIEIYEKRWVSYLSNRKLMLKLVFHEYLRVLKINDDNYVVSGLLNSDGFDLPSTLFENLNSTFQKAESVKDEMSDLVGAYIGNCLNKGEKKLTGSSSSLVIYYNYSYARRAKGWKIVEFENANASLDSESAFDGWSKSLLQREAKLHDQDFSLVSLQSDHITVRYPKSSSILQLKKSGNTLFAAYMSLINQEILFYESDKGLPVKPGDAWLICYYHKKL